MATDYAYEDDDYRHTLINGCYDLLHEIAYNYCPDAYAVGRLNVSQQYYGLGHDESAIKKLHEARDLMSANLKDQGYTDRSENSPYYITQIIANGVIDMLEGKQARDLFFDLIERMGDEPYADDTGLTLIQETTLPIIRNSRDDVDATYRDVNDVEALQSSPTVLARARDYGFGAAAALLCSAGVTSGIAAFIHYQPENLIGIGVASLGAAAACEALRGPNSVVRQFFTHDL